MKRLLIGVLVGLGLFAINAPAQQPATDKGALPTLTRAEKRFVVQPGEFARWRTRNIGEVQRISLKAGDSYMDYRLVPKTHACVAEAYGSGVAMRVTDCSKGRRVPYVRFRLANSNIRPVVVLVELTARL